jgi:hypothetical protein
MSETEVAPDPVVRTALQRLPIPPHTDAFWSQLNGLLDAEGASDFALSDGGADDHAPPTVSAARAALADAPLIVASEPDPALALVPRALRRTSNGVLLAVAAAAAVVVTLAGTTLLDERDGTQSGTSGEEVQAFQADSTLVDDTEPDDVTAVALSAESEALSSEAVLEWVVAVGGGDETGAWEAMGPMSQAHFGSQDAFAAEMSSLAEGYGAWSAAEPDEVLVTPVLSSGEGTTAVVTLIGMLDLEGALERRADAFPVRLVDGDAVIEPFASAGALEIVVPETLPAGSAPEPVTAGEELVVVVPGDAGPPILRLDDGDAVVCGQAEGSELTDLEGSPGQRCSYLPPEGMAEGEHTLTMAFVGSDGSSITAECMLFDAA